MSEGEFRLPRDTPFSEQVTRDLLMKHVFRSKGTLSSLKMPNPHDVKKLAWILSFKTMHYKSLVSHNEKRRELQKSTIAAANEFEKALRFLEKNNLDNINEMTEATNNIIELFEGWPTQIRGLTDSFRTMEQIKNQETKHEIMFI